jgi:hypothetical protein
VRVLLPVLLLLLVPARAPAQMSLQGACNFKFVSERTIDPLRASVEVFFDSQWPGGGRPLARWKGILVMATSAANSGRGRECVSRHAPRV